MPKTFVARCVRPALAASPDGRFVTAQREFAAPINIGVISDTHIFPGSRRTLSEPVLDLFRRFEVGLILHAGDANTSLVLEQLAAVAPVVAVIGNNDDASIQDQAAFEEQLYVGPHKVALLHGHGGL